MNTQPIDPRLFGDEPAHPYSQATESFHQAYAQYRGMTKREEFAAAALQGLLSNPNVVPTGDHQDFAEGLARMARVHAEALVVELARTSI